MLRNIAVLCCFFTISLLSAQSLRVEGRILDNDTGNGISGVTIYNLATQRGSISDLDGAFSIDRESDADSIAFSYIGFEEQIIQFAANEDNPYVVMKKSDTLLDEVVITALGLERESKSLGYAVEKLTTKSLSEVQPVNFVQNLAGKVAGVSVSQGATGIGSTSRISIRGEASFSNNTPLFVVDGMPINNNTILNVTNEAAAGFQEIDFGNGAMDINSEDIESVSVLKGPSAAALYGTRASNGVILINTKTGENQQGFGISYTSTASVETAFQLPQFQNQYGQGNSGQFEFVDGLGAGVNDNITYSWGPALDQGILIPQFDSPVSAPDGSIVRGGDVVVHGGAEITATPFVSYEDNLSDFYRTGTTLNNHLSLTNAFHNGSMRVSLGDMRNESIIPGSNFNRQNLSAYLNLEIADRLHLSSSINYIRSSSDNRPSNGYGSENVNYSLVAWGPRSLNTSLLQDYWQPGLEGLQQYSFNYTFFDNPYFILQENQNALGRNRFFGNISLRYDLSSKLSLALRTGTDYSSELRTFKRAYSTNRFRQGAYAEQNVSYVENNTDILLSYRDIFNQWEYEISAGANRLDQQANSGFLQTLSLAQPGVFSLTNAASPIESFDTRGNKRINSIYGLIKLNYRDRLYIDITGRNDWSSALATQSSSADASFFYPSISTGLILSEMFDLPEDISFLKTRLSWAQVGNDTDPYQTAPAFVAQTPFNSQPTFSAQDFITNTQLLPEKTSSYEIGLDARFYDDRLRVDATYYDAQTSNQIIALPVPISSGFNQQVINGGKVVSRGLELLVSYDWIRNQDIKWNTALNFSHNKTKVLELPGDIDRLTLAYSRVYDNVNQTVWFQVEEGGEVGDLYGTGYLKNENGDFIIDDNGRYIVDNALKKLGNYNPDYVLGLANQINYKNWNAQFLLDWRHGGQIVSRTLALAAVGGQLEETANRPEEGIVAQGVVNQGTVESPSWVANTQTVSAESYYRQYYDRNHEENNVYNASYLKLREFSLGYSFKNLSWFQEEGQQVNISVFGRNLFAISEIPHFDPEQLAVQGNRFVSGVEDMSYATSRSIGIRLNIQM